MKTRIGSFSPLSATSATRSRPTSAWRSQAATSRSARSARGGCQGGVGEQRGDAARRDRGQQKLYGVVHVLAVSGSSPTLDIVVKSPRWSASARRRLG
jgi:hypothetical protein